MECHLQAGCYSAEDETGELVVEDTKENENCLSESSQKWPLASRQRMFLGIGD